MTPSKPIADEALPPQTFDAWWEHFQSRYNHGFNDADQSVACAAFNGGYEARAALAAAAGQVEQREIERLKACLKWYADGNHFMVDDDWDTVSGEPQNWLEGEHGGMIEDGGIARTVLDGGHMVTDDEDIVAEALLTPDEYQQKLAEVERLVALDPAAHTSEAHQLRRLAGVVERYEKRMFPDLATPPQPPVRLVEGGPREIGQALDKYGEHKDRP